MVHESTVEGMTGYFERGVWNPVKKLDESLIGKRIIRMKSYQNGCDYSYCYNGFYSKQPDEWVILSKLLLDGSIVYKHRILTGENTLPPSWNDGNWVEYDPKVHK